MTLLQTALTMIAFAATYAVIFAMIGDAMPALTRAFFSRQAPDRYAAGGSTSVSRRLSRA